MCFSVLLTIYNKIKYYEGDIINFFIKFVNLETSKYKITNRFITSSNTINLSYQIVHGFMDLPIILLIKIKHN